MSKFLMRLTVVTLVLSLALAAAAQVRGRGRIQGLVVDKETGKPLEGAKVTIAISDGSTAPITATTDKRGRWAALGLVSGSWHVDIEMPGYATSRGTANVSEMQMLPQIRTELARDAAQEAPPPSVADAVPAAAVEAVRAGEAFMAEKKYAEAAAEFEKALALIPDNVELRQALGHAYYGARELDKGIAILEPLVTENLSKQAAALLLVNMYLESGRLPEAKTLIEKMPAGSLTDPVVFLNAGILSMNRNNVEDAVSWFTRAVDADPKRPESYYYRGLARLQLRQIAESKADLEKVIALAPDSTEAGEAKQMIAAMK